MKSRVSYGLSVIMNEGLSTLTSIQLRLGILVVGEAMDVWGQKVYGNSLYLLLGIPVTLKT